MVVDMDGHDEPKAHQGEDAAPPADPLFQRCQEPGPDPLRFDADGRGGYHPWLCRGCRGWRGRLKAQPAI
jgi:hypothetical protein